MKKLGATHSLAAPARSGQNEARTEFATLHASKIDPKS